MSFFLFAEKFLFCTGMIESIELPNLVLRQRIGDCSRFTSSTENFVICCYQVTKIFCSRCGCASALSARPCYFCPHADVAVSVLRAVSINTVLTDTTFPCGSEAGFTRRTRRCVPVRWNSVVHNIFWEFFQQLMSVNVVA